MGHATCCIVNCKNSGQNSNCKFYRFPTAKQPWTRERRKKWLAAVNIINFNGSLWVPKAQDLICSAHFIGGKKSEAVTSPSYIPTIFAPINVATQVHDFSAFVRQKHAMQQRRKKENVVTVPITTVKSNIEETSERISNQRGVASEEWNIDIKQEADMETGDTQVKSEIFDDLQLCGGESIENLSNGKQNIQTKSQQEIEFVEVFRSEYSDCDVNSGTAGLGSTSSLNPFPTLHTTKTCRRKGVTALSTSTLAYSSSLKSHLRLAIVDRNNPHGKLSQEVADNIKETLDDELERLLLTTGDTTPPPRFTSLTYIREVLIVNCDDDNTADWLKKTVSENQPLMGATLDVVRVVSLVKTGRNLTKVSLWIPGHGKKKKPDRDVTIKILARQNPELVISKWRVIRYELIEAPQGQLFVFGVDDKTIATLRSRKCNVSYRFLGLTVRINSMVEGQKKRE